MTRSERGAADTTEAEALTLVSRAVVAEVPDCAIADPQAWTVTPFSAVGALGCANRANLARMVSDPAIWCARTSSTPGTAFSRMPRSLATRTIIFGRFQKKIRSSRTEKIRFHERRYTHLRRQGCSGRRRNGGILVADASEVGDFTAMLKRLDVADARVMAGGGAAAIGWCAQHRAGVLIVDLDGASAPLKVIEDLAASCEPTCRIIAIGSPRGDRFLPRAAAQRRARLSAEARSAGSAGRDIGAGPHRRLCRDRADRAHSIAVTGCAGGLGASCVSAGLALLLSTHRHVPVAVVDFDRRKGDQGLLLGVTPENGLAAALANREIDPRLLERAMIVINPRLRLLAQEPTWSDLAVDGAHLSRSGPASANCSIR